MENEGISISVVMSVFNTEEQMLKESINSIIKQTFRKFEFIIIDDGSTNNAEEVIKSFNDNRIVLIKNNENIGLANSLNKGIRTAKGKYIARFDSDDISHPDRLEKQYMFMESHPEYCGCASHIHKFGEYNVIQKYINMPHEARKSALFMEYNGFAHPTLFFDRKFLIDNNLLYDGTFYYGEDFELIRRIIRLKDIYIIQEPLIDYRLHSEQITNKQKHLLAWWVTKVVERNINELEIELTNDELNVLISAAEGDCKDSKLLASLIKKIYKQNNKYKIYDENYFLKELNLYWYKQNKGTSINFPLGKRPSTCRYILKQVFLGRMGNLNYMFGWLLACIYQKTIQRIKERK